MAPILLEQVILNLVCVCFLVGRVCGHCGLDLFSRMILSCQEHISPISFEVGIPNLVYGCIFGW